MGWIEAVDRYVDPLVAHMRYRQHRHAAIASNIANADTPGYQAVDVTFGQALDRALGLVVTHPAHRPGVRARAREAVVPAGGIPRRDGNDVDIDREMAKLARNQIEYQFLARVLGGRFRKLKEAITGRSTP